MHRMRGLVGIGVLGIAACTADNPAYQAEGGGGESGPVGETVEETTAPASTTAETTVDGESSGDVPTCDLHDPRPLQIRVYDERGEIEPPCGSNDGMLLLDAGGTLFEGNVIVHPECLAEELGCLCTGPETRIEIEGLDELPAGVPSCGPITLWATEGPEGCVWGGVFMQPQGGLAPGFIAARTRQVPPLGPAFELGLARDPDDEGNACRGDCEPHAPGRYQLDVVGTPVPADGLSRFVEVAFLPGAPLLYEFENRMSSVTEECEEQVAWLTVLDP